MQEGVHNIAKLISLATAIQLDKRENCTRASYAVRQRIIKKLLFTMFAAILHLIHRNGQCFATLMAYCSGSTNPGSFIALLSDAAQLKSCCFSDHSLIVDRIYLQHASTVPRAAATVLCLHQLGHSGFQYIRHMYKHGLPVGGSRIALREYTSEIPVTCGAAPCRRTICSRPGPGDQLQPEVHLL